MMEREGGVVLSRATESWTLGLGIGSAAERRQRKEAKLLGVCLFVAQR